MSIDILKKQINEGKMGNLYLFYGPEVFLIRKYLALMEEKLVSKDLRDLNYSAFSGNVEANKIIDACETMPFLSERRLVVIKDSGLFKSAGKNTESVKESKKKKSSDSLHDFLTQLPEHVCVIFVEHDVDKRVRYYDAVKQMGLIVEFDYQKPSDLAKWVTMEFKALKTEISIADAMYLIEYSEPGMTDIYTQVQKLAAYKAEGGVVTKDDIHKICSKSIKRKIFDLTDAISERDANRALTMLREMIDLKEPVAKIFALIVRQFRSILLAKMLISRGFNKGMLAQKMGVHPFVAEKLYKQAGNFSVDELKNAVKESYEMDWSNKNSLMDDRVAAEILIAMFMAPVVKGRV